MKKLNEKRAIAEYNKGKESLVRMFLMKQGFEENGEPFDYEFLDTDKTMIFVCGYLFSIEDIYFDMVSRCDSGTILKWNDYNTIMISIGYKFVSYQSYLIGYRHKRSIVREYINKIYVNSCCFWYKCVEVYKRLNAKEN